MLRIQYQVIGKVQGVFFRDTTRTTAQQLGVTGWIRNTEEGHVAGEALGSPDNIAKFKEFLGQGPKAAKVEEVQILKEENVEDVESSDWTLNTFEVRRGKWGM